MNEQELLEAFKTEVCEKAIEVDPDSSEDWNSLSIGFFIAKGASPEMAHNLATTARYTYHSKSGVRVSIKSSPSID